MLSVHCPAAKGLAAVGGVELGCGTGQLVPMYLV
jgi:hypothetical protein